MVLYLLLSRRGPFGAFDLLFTPWAIMIGYIIIALPILIVFTVSAVQGGDPRIYETARCLGARPLRAALTTLWCLRVSTRVWSARKTTTSRWNSWAVMIR